MCDSADMAGPHNGERKEKEEVASRLSWRAKERETSQASRKRRKRLGQRKKVKEKGEKKSRTEERFSA